MTTLWSLPKPSRDPGVHQASGDFAVFTFSDSKGRVDSSNSSAPKNGAVSADAAVAASQDGWLESLTQKAKRAARFQ